MNSESRISRIFVLTLIVTVTSWSFAFVFSALAGELPFPKETLKKAGKSVNKNVQTVKEVETIELNGIEDIDIEIRNGDVEVVATDEEALRLEFEGTVAVEGKVFQIVRDGKELEINMRRDLESKLQWDFTGSNNFIGATEFLKVRVHVPRKYAKELQLSVASGDVKVKDIKLPEFEIKVASGSIRVENSQIDKAEFKLTSGDLTVSDLSGSLMAKVTSGDLKVTKYTGPSIDLRITSGDMSLSEIDSQDVEASATSGDIKISVKDPSGWKFKLRALSGDISNSLTEDPQGARHMKINATSGDITITK